MEYKLIRSGRRTLAAEIVRGGEIIVRAPYRVPVEQIEAFLMKNSEKINAAVKRAQNKPAAVLLSPKETDKLRNKAKMIIPERVAYYAEIMGVKPESVKITSAEKRFGSCSDKGRLCFSYKLMMYPEKAVDYVVVHELAHLTELNHSPAFWRIVEKYMPDYKERRAILRG